MTPPDPPRDDLTRGTPDSPWGIWMVKAAGAPIMNGEVPSSSSPSSSRAGERFDLDDDAAALVNVSFSGLSGNWMTDAAMCQKRQVFGIICKDNDLPSP